MPEVRISSIILETVPYIEKNPIDQNLSFIKTPDSLTGRLKTEYVPPDLEAKSEEKLQISLNIVIKEILEDNALSLLGFDLLKFVKIKIIQVSDNNLTQQLNNKDVLKYVGTPDFKRKHLNSSIDKYFNVFLEENITVKSLQIERNKQYSFERDSSGKNIQTIPLQIKFLFDKEPQHLSYFIYSYIDLEDINRELNLEIPSSELQPVGTASMDIVFENGSIVDQSFILVDQNNNIWNGPIEKVLENSFFGLGGVQLNRRAVPNPKIQDFRIIKRIPRFIEDFSFIENELSSVAFRSANIKTNTSNFFFDMLLSRDEAGQCKFIFGVNWRKIVANNSEYGKFLEDEQLDAPIFSIKILRRRIKGSPEIGSDPDISQKFNVDELDDIIVESGEKFFKSMSPIDNEKCSFEEIPKILNVSPELRFFQGVDKSMPLNSDGYFIYGIELEMKDPSYFFIASKIKELELAQIELKRYYIEATKLSTRTIISNNNPHIDYPNELASEKHEFVRGNFDPNLNRFTQNFITEQIKKYEVGKPPWEKATTKYVDILNLFYKNLPELTKILLFLNKISNPMTGSPNGILSLIELMEKLVSELSRIAGISHNPSLHADNLSGNGTLPPGIKKTTKTKLFKVSKFWDSIFNSNIPKEVGFNYIDVETINSIGLLTITDKQYIGRVDRETNHFFVADQAGNYPSIDLQIQGQNYTQGDSLNSTNLAYLTPAKISTSNLEIKRIGSSPTPKFNPEKLQLLDQEIKLFNTKSKSNNSLDFLATEHNIEFLFDGNQQNSLTDNIFGSFINARVNDIIIDPISEAENCGKKNPAFEPSAIAHVLIDKIIPDNKMVSIKNLIDQFDIQKSDNVFTSILNDSSKNLSSEFSQNKSTPSTLNETISALPNQIKSLYLSNIEPAAVRTDWTKIVNNPLLTAGDFQTEFRLNFNSISEIKVLDGFTSDILKKPNWVSLDEQHFQSSEPGCLICQSKPYENKILNISQEPDLNLPTYNETFLIQVPPKTLQVSIDESVKVIAPSTSIPIASTPTETFQTSNEIKPTIKIKNNDNISSLKEIPTKVFNDPQNEKDIFLAKEVPVKTFKATKKAAFSYINPENAFSSIIKLDTK